MPSTEFIFPVYPLLCWPIGVDFALFLVCGVTTIVVNYFLILRVNGFQFAILEQFNVKTIAIESANNLDLATISPQLQHRLVSDYKAQLTDILLSYVQYAVDVAHLILEYTYGEGGAAAQRAHATQLTQLTQLTPAMAMKQLGAPVADPSQSAHKVIQYLCGVLFTDYLRDVFLYSLCYSVLSIVVQWIAFAMVLAQWLDALLAAEDDQFASDNGFKIFTQLCLIITLCFAPILRVYRVFIIYFIQYNADTKSRRLNRASRHSIHHKLNSLIRNLKLCEKYEHLHFRQLFWFRIYVVDMYQKWMFILYLVINIVFFPGTMAYTFVYALFFGFLTFLPCLVLFAIGRCIYRAFLYCKVSRIVCKSVNARREAWYARWKYDCGLLLFMITFQILFLGGMRMSLSFYGDDKWHPTNTEQCEWFQMDMEHYTPLMFFVLASWILC